MNQLNSLNNKSYQKYRKLIQIINAINRLNYRIFEASSIFLDSKVTLNPEDEFFDGDYGTSIQIRNLVYFGIFCSCVLWRPQSWIESSWFLLPSDHSFSSTCFFKKTLLVSFSFIITQKVDFSLMDWNLSLNNCNQLLFQSSINAIGTILKLALCSKVEVDLTATVFWSQRRIGCYQMDLFLCSERLNGRFLWEESH